MQRLIASIVLWSLAGSAQALEIWLASSESCNSCAIYERAAQHRGYGRALRYADGAGLTIPILSIQKNVLAADVLRQLPEDEGPGSPSWDVTLTVLIMDAGRVLLAGNIAESADNNELRHSNAVMFPPESPARNDSALRNENPYAAFFTSHWNLEYFVDVVLGKRPARVRSRPVDLASPLPASLGASNVILWGSAETPLSNALFIPTRISEIRAVLERMNVGALRYITLYGHGPDVQGNDTSYIADGRIRFQRADLAADFAADAAGLNSVLTSVLHGDQARTLLVQVGHSGPTGSPLWGHALTLAPEDIEPIKRESGGKMIMVSGACHSGLYAQAVQCGFFAAHPDVLASGCQLSPEALQASDDYLRHFFRAASGGGAARGKRSGQPETLYDAHWYASTRLEDHQLSYTTTDALIDDYFAAHAEDLPAALTVAEIRRAARTMTRSEADAVAALTQGLAPEMSIALTGYVDANHTADAALVDAAEMSSAQRNRIIALPYKLVLPLLARRAVYAALRVNDADYAIAASCERQSLHGFFGAHGSR
ncbi:MAG TPA: hypothetical protein VJA26_01235 [Gammaproteobacteria bacterium]|nr:hypothetical protein [Gammaproteobacteria bacterium]